MTVADFVELRRSGIGGSDVAAILGLSKYRTPLDVYLEKRGLVETSGSVRMEMGRYMESAILNWYCDGSLASRSNRALFVRHTEHEFLIGNLDLAMEHGADEWVVDAKNVHFRALAEWGEEGTDNVPNDALFQAHHYLYLCPWANWLDFIVCRGGAWPPRIQTVHRDDELYSVVLPQLVKFWREHIERCIPPAPDFNDVKTLDAVRALFPPTPEKAEPVALQAVVDLGGKLVRVAEIAEAYEFAKRQEKSAESLKRKLEAVLRHSLGNNRAGSTEEGVIITRIYNRGGDRPATHVAPYDYPTVKFPKDYASQITAERVALIAEGASNG